MSEKEDWGFLKNITWGIAALWTFGCFIVWTFFMLLVHLSESIFIGKKIPNKNKFWENVIKCLIKFHCKSFDEAMQLVSGYRSRPMALEFYLQEPFRVANMIACKDVILTPDEYKEQYLKQILGKK